MPTVRSVHANRHLTDIAVAYMQDPSKFVADKVFPTVPVEKKSDLYFVYDKGDWLRDEAMERGPSSESAGSGFRVSDDAYLCKRYAFHKDVDDETRENADEPLNEDADAAAFVAHKMALKREVLFVGKYFKTGVWGTDLTGVDANPNATQFLRWNKAGATPVDDIARAADAMEQATGFRPNGLLLGAELFRALNNAADILDRIKGVKPGYVTEEELQVAFKVPQVHVARAVKATSKEGQAFAGAYLFGKNALLYYAPPSPGKRVPSAGYTFSWKAFADAGNNGVLVRKFRMDEKTSDRIEGEFAIDQKVVGADLGVFLAGALS